VTRIASIAALLLGTTALAAGTGQTVSQKDKQFLPDTLTVNTGESVTFNNDDQVTHDITITRPDGSTMPGVMEKPGDHATFTFDKSGQYKVQCLIHPKMKMTITAQ
jgi:plastocyanin